MSKKINNRHFDLLFLGVPIIMLGYTTYKWLYELEYDNNMNFMSFGDITFIGFSFIFLFGWLIVKDRNTNKDR